MFKIKKTYFALFVIMASTLFAQHYETSEVNINNVKFPIRNDGDNGVDGIIFDSSNIGFSIGFYLTENNNGEVWSNGMFHSSRVLDYLPGNVGSDANDIRNKIYTLTSSESDFNASWGNWKDAVEQGALFYDGDADGVYNPVDKNENGKWDTDEDRPDLMGDYTAWSVFNDSKEATKRKYSDVTPKGIEINQTIFAYSLYEENELNNTIFIRYIIKNKSEVVSKYDSVYFSLAFDADIGDYWDDLVGSNEELNSTFAYNNEADEKFGDNPPAVFITLLQGPLVDGTASDEGYLRRGGVLGEVKYASKKNLEMTSSITPRRNAVQIPIQFGDPETKEEANNLIVGGKYHDGRSISVRDFELGNGDELGDSANGIDPKYMFSGNPVENSGWLPKYESDWRTMNSTGPFELERDKPIELIYALIVGRGENSLNSLIVAEEYANRIIDFYKSNFDLTVIDVKKHTDNLVVDDLQLYQNYPNPFNPTTIIKFGLPEQSNVKIEIFNMLGQSVAVLVDTEKSAGFYETTWIADNLPSGIYLISIRAKGVSSKKSFAEVKKALLLK